MQERAVKMVLLTMIARLVDGLPLAASMPSDEQVNKTVHQAMIVCDCQWCRGDWVVSRLSFVSSKKMGDCDIKKARFEESHLSVKYDF